MADDLRASIAEAMETEIKDEPVKVAVEETVADNQVEVSSGDSAPDEAPRPDSPAVTDAAEVTPEPIIELPPAPASWKGDAKQVWADLPEAARNEVIRRETHVNRVLSENAEVRNYAGAIQQVTERHAERIAQFNMPPAQVFDTLLEADRMLSTAEPIQKAQYMAKLIKDYGIDISALDNALSGAVPAIPDVSRQVQMQVDAALAPFRQREQSEQQERQQQVAATIEMMENNPEFPQFDAVREEMADLIEIKANRGIYIDLEQAYAIVTGQSPIAKQQQQIATAKQATATAQKAKSAAVSVSGTPSSSTGGADPTDLRGTISSILDGIR